ncbi:U-box domain-containing protein 33 isoform X1 [Brachypodium distachyon]|uniref:U-box domain-containing protein 33 isoform X1 n=1 Tax=Brachypodium distachyon TaxID=15368 RepID=UPI000D0E2232|nr:U-box domain-containing protein 33 isoform X1 [Brachypodium distachyon]XP_024318688.1 U-box domain-containing protein 33 isoform X1 [Brachypodium distachyon]|eukprot:XP_024318687.1 U-box domain-containing protein 33 isoform X1 [Brachypodium distachyon]
MATAGIPSPRAGDSPEPSSSVGSDGEGGEREKVYLAVGREVAGSKALVLWALHKFPKDAAAFVLIHVYSRPKFLPIMGAKIPASQVGEQELIAHKKIELQRISDILDQNLLLCAQEKVQAEKMVVESDDVAERLVQLISEHRVTALVMGAAADKNYTKKMKALKSKKAQIVEQQADPFCRIWYICKGTLVYRRKTTPLSHEAMQEGRLKSGAQKFSVDRSTSLSETWCVSNTWLHKPNLEPHIERTSPNRSCDNEKEDVKEYDKPDNKIQHILRELESARQQAYEEKCSREKAERELFEASQKAQASENMYFGEVKQKNEIEEKLTTTMEEVERLTETTDELCAKLQEERKKKLALEKKIGHSDRIIKDLMLQRDKAVREVEALRAKKGESSATAEGTMHITQLSCSEIKEATNNFEQSLKVGESVYGSVYKGILRHTNVAIKKLNPEITQSQSQFNQEVEILSRVRHPNLVTLIGACKDTQALVYEYMPNGSLDDRLACKDNSKPLGWQLRARIVSDVCSALIFLHSNKPHSIVHSDLKASNILLDGNNVAKLSGFGVCRMSTDEFRDTTTLYRHTHPKGSFVYIDPEYVMTGDLTPLSDVYSFGIVLLRLLTGRPGFGLLKDVQRAVEKGCLEAILDSSAGDWPAMQAEQLARVGLRCCEIRRKNRPDLKTEVWTVLEQMLQSASTRLCSLSFKSVSEDLGGVPSYFICPILQDVMREPLIAADGFTYEAEAIREWIDSGHHTSPMTNLELLHRDLLPNHALRSAIQEWLCRLLNKLKRYDVLVSND